MFSYSFNFIFHVFLSMGQDINHGSLHILSIDIFCLSSSFVYTTHRFFLLLLLFFGLSLFSAGGPNKQVSSIDVHSFHKD